MSDLLQLQDTEQLSICLLYTSACKYQFERRRHEFGVYLMLGMRRSKLFGMLLAENFLTSILATVSYTHLDVYKRQPVTGADNRKKEDFTMVFPLTKLNKEGTLLNASHSYYSCLLYTSHKNY